MEEDRLLTSCPLICVCTVACTPIRIHKRGVSTFNLICSTGRDRQTDLLTLSPLHVDWFQNRLQLILANQSPLPTDKTNSVPFLSEALAFTHLAILKSHVQLQSSIPSPLLSIDHEESIKFYEFPGLLTKSFTLTEIQSQFLRGKSTLAPKYKSDKQHRHKCQLQGSIITLGQNQLESLLISSAHTHCNRL